MLGLLAAALEAGSDALVGHLLCECDLPGWLAAAPLWVTPLPREGDPRCVSKGFMFYCDLPGSLAAAPLWVTPLPREGNPRCVLKGFRGYCNLPGWLAARAAVGHAAGARGRPQVGAPARLLACPMLKRILVSCEPPSIMSPSQCNEHHVVFARVRA